MTPDPQDKGREEARELLAAVRGFLALVKGECPSLLEDNCDIDRLDSAMARMDFRLREGTTK